MREKIGNSLMKREDFLESIKRNFDIIIIGGGITGAGILLEASKKGLSCALIEQKDFAWGTSSRSGKLVHGGLRYLKEGQVSTTLHSVTERDRMLEYYKGLVEPLGFLVPIKKHDFSYRLMIKTGLTIYDILAKKWVHRYHEANDFQMMLPSIRKAEDPSGYTFQDAVTDDARLVIEIIKESIQNGAVALNYTKAFDLIKNKRGDVKGLLIKDMLNDDEYELKGDVVINATGVWAGDFHSKIKQQQRLRPLRGSHLLFPNWRFPLPQAVSIAHPRDRRPIYLLPWKGATLIGTTDVDHQQTLLNEPNISQNEAYYLFEALEYWFPSLELTPSDLLSTISGVRAVIDTGKKDPSKESREHIIWNDHGLISVTGGKLTAFRYVAQNVLKEAKKYIKHSKKTLKRSPNQQNNYLFDTKEYKQQDNLIAGTPFSWSDLKDSIQNEWVNDLSDLLLRRTRIGLTAPNGAIPLLDEIQLQLEPFTDWDWTQKRTEYINLWQRSYSPQLIAN